MGRYLLEHEYAFAGRWLGQARQPCRVLDLACGSGSMGLPLRIDLDPLALAEIRRQSNRMPLVAGDALLLPFANNSFDCVIAIECFEYFTDCRGFLRAVNRVLVNGGTLIFDSLNRLGYKWWLKALLGRGVPYPSPELSCGELLRATVEHGFDVQGIRGYGWVPFTRDSNSPLLPLAALIENKLRLSRYSSISPKILVAARKREAGMLCDGTDPPSDERRHETERVMSTT